MVEVSVNGRRFKTKKELGDYVSGELESAGETRDLRGTHPELYAFVMDLLAHHPRFEEKLSGHARLEVVRSGAYELGGRGLMIHYEDGRFDDVSWRKSIAAMAPPGGGGGGRKAAASDARQRLQDALREAVQDQVSEHYRRAFQMCGVIRCGHCGCRVDRGAAHVDHVVPFADLVKGFLSSSGTTSVPEEAVVDAPTYAGLQRHRLADAYGSVREAWAAYHRSNAVLQIACARCNLSDLRTSRANKTKLDRSTMQ